MTEYPFEQKTTETISPPPPTQFTYETPNVVSTGIAQHTPILKQPLTYAEYKRLQKEQRAK
jgi:hypothetical protein